MLFQNYPSHINTISLYTYKMKFGFHCTHWRWKINNKNTILLYKSITKSCLCCIIFHPKCATETWFHCGLIQWNCVSRDLFFSPPLCATKHDFIVDLFNEIVFSLYYFDRQHNYWNKNLNLNYNTIFMTS